MVTVVQTLGTNDVVPSFSTKVAQLCSISDHFFVCDQRASITCTHKNFCDDLVLLRAAFISINIRRRYQIYLQKSILLKPTLE